MTRDEYINLVNTHSQVIAHFSDVDHWDAATCLEDYRWFKGYTRAGVDMGLISEEEKTDFDRKVFESMNP